MGIKKDATRPILIHMDSIGALDLSRNDKVSKYTKHIDVRRFFIRDHIDKGDVKLEYISTTTNAADTFTKALPRPRFEELRNLIGVMSLGEAIRAHGATSDE